MRSLLAAIACVGMAACSAERTAPSAPAFFVRDALGQADVAGFERADRVRAFDFPRDHGPHESFRSEWWYFTGNLAGEGGERFGFQVTIFRSALRPTRPETKSKWAANQLYMAHFALVRAADGKRVVEERFGRGALGLAGAVAKPFRVWLDDWSVASTGESFFPLRLRAKAAGCRFDLELRSGKQMVLQGDRGLSQKSAEPGNASYYYSYTRLPARGRIHFAGEDHVVTGSAWMDREWSTSALGKDQVGWDWFALQLSDGCDLMFYRMRRSDGSQDPKSAGVLVDRDGGVRRLGAAAVELVPIRFFTSPRTGARYPVEWRLRAPAQSLDLKVAPVVDDQELPVSLQYWEGAVDVTGVSGTAPVTGRGYVELVGYGPGAAGR